MTIPDLTKIDVSEISHEIVPVAGMARREASPVTCGDRQDLASRLDTLSDAISGFHRGFLSTLHIFQSPAMLIDNLFILYFLVIDRTCCYVLKLSSVTSG